MLTLIDEEFVLGFDATVPNALGTAAKVRWVDIETYKTAAPASFPFSRRWQPFMIGIAGATDPGILFVTVLASDDEAELIEAAEILLADNEVRYSATREFDEMVLRGRFTNARRAHMPVAGSWPNLDAAEITWRNMRKLESGIDWERPVDVASKEVPEAWSREERSLVAIHCAKDVVENVLRDSTVVLNEALRAELKDFVATKP